MSDYFRPLVQTGPAPAGAVQLAGGWCWCREVEHLRRGKAPEPVPVEAVPPVWLSRLTTPRPDMAGLSMDRPRLMGIVNVTPDSFSDGGRHDSVEHAVAHGQRLVENGADLLDIGGESTRPGAMDVPVEAEIARTAPVIAGLRARLDTAISLDTRKGAVARAGEADLVNDVSGLTYDPDLSAYLAQNDLPVCVMHAQGSPQNMQDNPRYDDVLLDVYDWLEERLTVLESQGIARQRTIVDPGIGFGKTQAHNLALLRGLSLFHGLGAPILLGVSRKGFIGRIADVRVADARDPGSVAVALAALGQGVQILRVHNVADHAQAIALWRATVA